jgi:hypothetical protein
MRDDISSTSQQLNGSALCNQLDARMRCEFHDRRHIANDHSDTKSFKLL